MMSATVDLKYFSKTMKSAGVDFNKSLFKWMKREGRRFIGKANRPGWFREMAIRSKTGWTGDRWNKGIEKKFKYKVAYSRTSMALDMGLIKEPTTKEGKSVFHGLELMEDGVAQRTYNKFAPVPVKGEVKFKPQERFQQIAQMIEQKSKRVKMVFKNGRIYYFLDNRLLFVARKQWPLKKQFSFYGMYNVFRGGMEKRLIRTMNATARKVSSMTGKTVGVNSIVNEAFEA